jgi:hypothetical protein
MERVIAGVLVTRPRDAYSVCNWNELEEIMLRQEVPEQGAAKAGAKLTKSATSPIRPGPRGSAAPDTGHDTAARLWGCSSEFCMFKQLMGRAGSMPEPIIDDGILW